MAKKHNLQESKGDSMKALNLINKRIGFIEDYKKSLQSTNNLNKRLFIGVVAESREDFYYHIKERHGLHSVSKTYNSIEDGGITYKYHYIHHINDIRGYQFDNLNITIRANCDRTLVELYSEAVHNIKF